MSSGNSSLTEFAPQTLGPQKNERSYFIAYGAYAAPLGLPTMEWDIDDENAFNDETDCFDARKIRAICPACKREQSSLCSPHTRLLENDWRWVGCDHREPYCKYVTRCRCGVVFLFTTFTPQ